MKEETKNSPTLVGLKNTARLQKTTFSQKWDLYACFFTCVKGVENSLLSKCIFSYVISSMRGFFMTSG